MKAPTSISAAAASDMDHDSAARKAHACCIAQVFGLKESRNRWVSLGHKGSSTHESWVPAVPASSAGEELCSGSDMTS